MFCMHERECVHVYVHEMYVYIYIYYIPVLDVSRLSDVRVADGVVQWNTLSNLPGECYGSYSFPLSLCSIMAFTILPTLTLSDITVNRIISGECVMLCLI